MIRDFAQFAALAGLVQLRRGLAGVVPASGGAGSDSLPGRDAPAPLGGLDIEAASGGLVRGGVAHVATLTVGPRWVEAGKLLHFTARPVDLALAGLGL